MLLPPATPGDLEKLFDEPLPEKGISADEILDRFTRDIAPHSMGVPSPATTASSIPRLCQSVCGPMRSVRR